MYCKAQCGTNIHEVHHLPLRFSVLYYAHFPYKKNVPSISHSFPQACFNQWAATKGTGKVTCVMCRQPWQGDGNAHEALAKGYIGEEGYVNVGSQLGMSGYRGMWHPL